MPSYAVVDVSQRIKGFAPIETRAEDVDGVLITTANRVSTEAVKTSQNLTFSQ